jgi:hypothetical protein
MQIPSRAASSFLIFSLGLALGWLLQNQETVVSTSSMRVSTAPSIAPQPLLDSVEFAQTPDSRGFTSTLNVPQTQYADADLAPDAKQSRGPPVHVDHLGIPPTGDVSRAEPSVAEPPEELAVSPSPRQDMARPLGTQDGESVEAELRLASEAASVPLPSTSDAGLLEHERH